MESKHLSGEINLLHYVSIIVKKRKIFLSILAVFMMLGFLKSFFISETYKVTEIIELPSIGGALISASSFKARIEEGIYSHRIKENLKLSSASSSLKVEILRGQEIMKVSTQVKKNQINTAVKTLDSIFILLEREVQPILERGREGIDKKISLLNLLIEKTELEQQNAGQRMKSYINQIKASQGSITALNSYIFIINERIVELTKETGTVGANLQGLLGIRDKIMAKQSSDYIMLYNTNAQKQIAYINQLNNQLSGLRMEKEKLAESIAKEKSSVNEVEIKIESLESKKLYLMNNIKMKRIEIISLQSERSNFKPIQKLQPPQTVIIAAKTAKMVVMVKYLVYGLIFGLFVVFGVDFYRKNKSEILGENEE